MDGGGLGYSRLRHTPARQPISPPNSSGNDDITNEFILSHLQDYIQSRRNTEIHDKYRYPYKKKKVKNILIGTMYLQTLRYLQGQKYSN